MVASKLGIDPSLAQIAIGSLTKNYPVSGDTIQQSAQETGIPTDILGTIVSQIGGEGGLGALVGAIGSAGGQSQSQAAPEGGLGGILSGLGGLGGIAAMLDRDGDGNPLNDLAGMLGKK